MITVPNFQTESQMWLKCDLSECSTKYMKKMAINPSKSKTLPSNDGENVHKCFGTTEYLCTLGDPPVFSELLLDDFSCQENTRGFPVEIRGSDWLIAWKRQTGPSIQAVKVADWSSLPLGGDPVQ